MHIIFFFKHVSRYTDLIFPVNYQLKMNISFYHRLFLVDWRAIYRISFENVEVDNGRRRTNGRRMPGYTISWNPKSKRSSLVYPNHGLRKSCNIKILIRWVFHFEKELFFLNIFVCANKLKKKKKKKKKKKEKDPTNLQYWTHWNDYKGPFSLSWFISD